ncbi:MAG TPA: HAMP domain-containing sensor histidine kinase, partial [Longimicrobiales bacterium]|nr:HAMP domain-containing sensor histidine kinase [Longimicrobiales bacterium]
MTLRARYLLSLLGVIALPTLASLYALNRLNEVRDIASDLRSRAATGAFAVGRLRTELVDLDRYSREYVATLDPDLGRQMRDAFAGVTGQIDELREAGFGSAMARAPFPLTELAAVVVHTDSLTRAGAADSHGVALDSATAYLRTTAKPTIAQAEASVGLLADAINKESATMVDEAQRSTVAATTAATTAILGSVAGALLLGILFAGFLIRPLERLRAAMGRVADGDFDVPPDLPLERRDEVGELFRSFRSMAMRLAELDRMKAEFVGVASHDLKTPISVITSYAELIEEELADTLGGRALDLVRSLGRQAEALAKRLNQLLEISRIEAGHARLGLEEINIQHFADGLRERYVPVASRKEVRLSVDVQDSAPQFLIADPDSLREDIMGNLIGNAIKFTPAGGRVHVRIRGESGRLVFDVVDTGPGISADELEFVFKKYYQGRLGRRLGG